MTALQLIKILTDMPPDADCQFLRHTDQVESMNCFWHDKRLNQIVFSDECDRIEYLQNARKKGNEGMKTVKQLILGDYVLATKYHDGDPMDHFCVGFFAGMLIDRDGKTTDRYLVQDDKGVLCRAGGFRRCERISRRTGDIIVSAMPYISDRPGKSMWYWRRHLAELEKMVKELNKQNKENGK